MERRELVENITEFYFDTGLFDGSTQNEDETKLIIENCLGKVEIIETIINTIILRAKTHKNFDIEQLKKMLLELEKIRLELEYEDCDLIS